MSELFLTLFNRAVAAGWLVLAVVALRALLRRAPKNVRLLLWGLVAFRLLLPVAVKSPVSLVPSVQTLPREALYAAQPAIDSGIPAINAAVNPALAGSMAPAVGDSVNPLQVWLAMGSAVWLIGLAAMLLYMLVSALLLRRRVAAARPLRENIWLCAGLSTPFVLGLLRPQIYLPLGMDEETMALVLAHEQGHITRHDHWLKPFGFLLLAVYWFQPLLWLGYVLFCRDLELACDEYVLRSLGQEVKKPYAHALVSCSTGERISACPVAFGEGGVTERVKNALRFRPASRRLLLALIPLFMLLSVLFLTDPGLTLRPEAKKVERIEIFDGTTGRALTVTDREQIEQIVSMTRALELRRRGVSLGYSGYSYRVTFEPTGGSFILNSADSLRKDPFFYRITGETELYGYIGELYGRHNTEIEEMFETYIRFLDPDAPDISGFRCTVTTPDGKSRLITDQLADDLYRLVIDAYSRGELRPDYLPLNETIYLSFRSPSEAGKSDCYYGEVYICSDDSCEVSLSPYYSSAQHYLLPAGTYQGILDLISNVPSETDLVLRTEGNDVYLDIDSRDFD